MVDKNYALSVAVEIIKEWARGGASGNIAAHLEEVYKMHVKLQQDAVQ